MKTHLWKEWREHRATTLVLAAAIPALLLLAKWTLPDDVNDYEIVPPLAAFAALAIAAFAYGADIVPGERRRGRLAFLRRLPAGARAPFAAKACLVAAAYAGFPAYAYVCAGALLGFPAEAWSYFWWVLGTELVVAAWMFAVSCWLPRGALALPAAALLIGMIVLPIVWLGWFHGMRPAADELRGALWWGGAGAAVVAALTFVRGSLAGALALAAVATPLWAYAGVRTHDWITLDLAAEDLVIEEVVLSPSRRFAYLTARSGGPRHAVRVDLATGAYTTHGRAGDWFYGRYATVVGLVDGRSRDAQSGRVWAEYRDTETFARIAAGWSDMELPGLDARRDAPSELDGWTGRFETATAFYAARFENGRLRKAIYDKSRERVFYDVRDANVRPGSWVIGRRRNFRLYDPETKRDLGPAKLPAGTIAGIRPDGRILMAHAGELAAFDPETGGRTAIARRVTHAWRPHPCLDVVHVKRSDGSYTLVRVSNPENRIDTDVYVRLVTRLKHDALIGIRGNAQLVRLDFETGKMTPLFPR